MSMYMYEPCRSMSLAHSTLDFTEKVCGDFTLRLLDCSASTSDLEMFTADWAAAGRSDQSLTQMRYAAKRGKITLGDMYNNRV